MKERPILFSAPMVLATLDDRKTQTRREVKHEWHPDTVSVNIIDIGDDGVAAMPYDEFGRMLGGAVKCPYGPPSGMLYGREAFRFTADLDQYCPARVGELSVDAGYKLPWAPIQYEADGQRRNWEHTSRPLHSGPPIAGRYRHARFMPRWASRIDLGVTSVRVERLQDIGEADAMAEGVCDQQICTCPPDDVIDFVRCCGNCGLQFKDVVSMYRALWEQINGAGSWAANPWVWVVGFKRVKP